MAGEARMKTLFDVVRAAEMREAKAQISTARGSPSLRNCCMIYAVPHAAKGVLAAILVGPYNTVSDKSFEEYVADLDNPNSWLSLGVEPPRRPVQREA
jgi:hypothetical protein